MRSGKKTITLLVDQAAWVRPLVEALGQAGVEVALVDIKKLHWRLTDPLPRWGLVVNRISARPDQGKYPSGWLTLARDLLTTLEMAHVPCINGRLAFQVGASKALQAVVFRQLGLRTPATTFVAGGTLSGEDSRSTGVLLKPNSGGHGKGISRGNPDVDALLKMDGAAVEQQFIQSGDRCIYRLELLGGEPLYLASSPLEEGAFNYCLSRSGGEVELAAEVPEAIRLDAAAVAGRIGMGIGSVEYLLDESGQVWFIDINPVSSYHPGVKERLGFDPWQRQAAWLLQSG